jgi:DNA helicase II / ATP-dependent DNA helicase PcrA
MAGVSKIRTKLDQNQLQAVSFGNGPLLIIAGAGTGKTTVITQRIKHLIVDRKIPSQNILALTFTEKATFEMQERLDVLLPYGYTDLWVNTFHSFCDKVLRDDAFTIGLDPNYKLISETESILLLRKHIFDLGLSIFKPLGNPTKFLDALLTHFSRLKDEDISPNEYLIWAQTQNKNANSEILNLKSEINEYLELANAYKKYEELKVKEGLMDFADLISNTLLVFRLRPNVLKRYQEKFKYILVDEFQDTNFAQNELAMLLAGQEEKNITVVADDDQSIYRFRGAAISNVLQFKKNYKDAKIIVLSNNYRSTQIILDAAYNLIQNNNPTRLEVTEKINKKLNSFSNSKGKEIKLIQAPRNEDEADEIAKEIKILRKNYRLRDMAILVRANNHSQSITHALRRYRIPYQFLGPGFLFQQDEVKDLIAYLNFLANLSDSVSLFRVLSMPIFDIPVIELNFMLNFAKQKNYSLFESILEPTQNFLKEKTKNKLTEFTQMVEKHLKQIKKETAGQILYYFLVDSGLMQTLNNVDSLKEEKAVQNIAKFFDRIKNFESEKPKSNIFDAVEWINLMMDLGDSPTAANLDAREENAVNILTVHASKGLEFKVVFLVNLVNDRFPSRERSEKIPLPQNLIKEKVADNIDFHLQEERRLFYVGMTRAKEILYFTAAKMYGEGKRLKKLSPFIFEALPKLIINEQKEKSMLITLAKSLESYTTKIEKEESKKKLKIKYVTYSNLQMFDICPLHYKAKAILGIPTPKSFVQSFGISLHNTLYNFYKLIQIGEKPDLDKMLSIFKKEWINEGYNNKKHEKESLQRAIKTLKTFYKTECEPSEAKCKVPLALELPFSFILKGGIKVSGKIDRIDPRPDGGIEIIDYKTGQDNPKAKEAHELQLAIYALAATKVKDKILNRKASEITLTLHFIEQGTKKSMTFTKEDLQKFEKELLEKIKEIEQSDFKCSKNILCKTCEYKILCSA